MLIINLMKCRRRIKGIYKEKKGRKGIKIPSEMKVAPPPKLLTLFTPYMFKVFSSSGYMALGALEQMMGDWMKWMD